MAAGQNMEHLLEMVARLEAEGAESKEKIARLVAEGSESKEKIARLVAEGSESKEKIARFEAEVARLEAESCNNKELNQFIRPVLIPI